MNEGTFIEADSDRLHQVLDNLMDNAVKQTHQDQRRIRIETEILHNTIRFRIIDNGAGITHDNLERIFHQFTAIPTQYSEGGTGIGLYLSRMIVEAHGGKLTAHSEEKGQGSMFLVELPKRRIVSSTKPRIPSRQAKLDI